MSIFSQFVYIISVKYAFSEFQFVGASARISGKINDFCQK